MTDTTGLEAMIKAFNDWVDQAPVNAPSVRSAEALTWHRVSKVAEESGEVIDEMIRYVGGNPRKPQAENADAMIKELYDTANAALGAIVHLRGTPDGLIDGLVAHVRFVNERVGLVRGDEPLTLVHHRWPPRRGTVAICDAQPPYDPPLDDSADWARTNCPACLEAWGDQLAHLPRA